MKKIVFIAAIVMASPTMFAQDWTLDKAHAKLGFSITHMLVSDVEGNLKKFDITLDAKNADFTDAKINLTADVNSINTDFEQRDNHIKSPSFFDVKIYPTILFKSKSLKKINDKKYVLTGDLTMRGVTKFVSLDVIYNGTVLNPNTQKKIAGFKLSGKVKRSDFGIGPDFSEAILSDEVILIANLEFTQN
jgi:polyisoprenoid-binding protein YceI